MGFSKVRFHDEFRGGTKNTPFATDWNNLNTTEKARVAQFISDLSQQKDFEGTNKESWICRHSLSVISTATIYKNSNAWHYHCGPTYITIGTVKTPFSLIRNLSGSDSEQALHYMKISADILTIFGYSKNHIPFLNEKNFSYKPGHPYFSALLRKFASKPF